MAGAASSGYLIGTVVQSLVLLNNSWYVPTGWQACLLAIA